ncbi:hypothetical protein [Catellatospora methionotrophica]|uniref:hypothetical protein n=1 Tax=Catellatospora methionotrophica TaxID=121620 RepID=UPI0033E23172
MNWEDELSAGMREHTADLKPSADLLDRATRRNRRRTAAMASGTGVFALAAVVAVAMTVLGGTPAVPVEPGTRPAPELLTVAVVSERAVAALAADDVQHVVSTTTHRGATEHGEWWFDQETGDSHMTYLAADGAAVEREIWLDVRDDTVTTTEVSHRDRTYLRLDRPAEGGRPGSPAGRTVDELRTALGRDDGYTLVGPAELDGRAVLRLRLVFEDGTDDLWVDAESYRAVRRELVKHTPDGDARNRLDFTWLPRTPETLATLTATIPPTYTEKVLPPIDGPM